MKTLHVRFAMTTIAIMLLSGLVAFLLSNVYYQIKLKPYNDQKITKMANDIISFQQTHPQMSIDSYLTHLTDLGMQILLIDETKKIRRYGTPFYQNTLPASAVRQVLQGRIYHGIAQFSKGIFVTGFFDDDPRNSIGVPLKIHGEQYALFIRPNVEYQFSEMHIFFAVLLALTVVFSLLFVAVGAYYIGKPIRLLTSATQKIAQGRYDVDLNLRRRDEIGQLSRHFAQMAQSLQQLDEMRQTFVSNVSHEIQSPLASIQGFSKTLQTSPLSNEQSQQYLKIIETESQRLSILSKQLLILASLDKEERRLEKKTVNLTEQIKQVIMMTEWQWREKELMIELKLSPVSVQADAELLHQVWINLITNSIKFTPAGGTIIIQTNSTVKKKVCVEIKDTGIGIPKEECEHIFERFYKVDKARERKEEGNGLGLSIVKKIVDEHRGTIKMTSQPNEGTRFIVCLPGM